jgi:hypothetical protein
MDTSTAALIQVALAALCVVSLAFALVTALRLRAIHNESTELDDTDTKTIVKVRLLESRVSELEATIAELVLSRDSTDAVPDLIDLRTPTRTLPLT